MTERIGDKDLLLSAVALARNAGAHYSEVRGSIAIKELLGVRTGRLTQIQSETDTGWGLRVQVDKGWGFASSAELTEEAVQRVTRQAIEIAKSSARVQYGASPTESGTPSRVSGEYATPVGTNPFEVPISEKIELLLRAEDQLRKASNVKATEAKLFFFRTSRFFANSAGARQNQLVTESGASLSAIAVHDGDSRQRTYENTRQAGYEFILGMNLEDEAAHLGEEASELVVSDWVPPGPSTVVLGSSLVALIVHETCGHPTELDRVLGSEDAFAGGSFLLPHMRGSFSYGSPVVNLTADATLPGGLGTFGWDDEGIPAQRVPLVRQGTFVGYQSSRETAAVLNLESGGMARAATWGDLPLVRITNVNLEPGEGNLAALIADVKQGLYLDTPSSWSLDDQRLNFHFSAEICREIKDGRLGKLYRGASFQSRTPAFWGNCIRVAGPSDWRLWSFLDCSKGEPLQDIHVSHGTSPIIVSNMFVQREE